MFKTIEKTLSANTNILQLTDSVIDNDSIIEVYGDDEEVIAVGIDVSGHTLTITFDNKLPDAHDVKIFVNNLDGEFSPSSGSVTDEQVSITSTGITETTQKAVNEKVYSDISDIEDDIEELQDLVPSQTTVGGVLYHGTTGNEWKKLSGSNIDYDNENTVSEELTELDERVTELENTPNGVYYPLSEIPVIIGKVGARDLYRQYIPTTTGTMITKVLPNNARVINVNALWNNNNNNDKMPQTYYYNSSWFTEWYYTPNTHTVTLHGGSSFSGIMYAWVDYFIES